MSNFDSEAYVTKSFSQGLEEARKARKPGTPVNVPRDIFVMPDQKQFTVRSYTAPEIAVKIQESGLKLLAPIKVTEEVGETRMVRCPLSVNIRTRIESAVVDAINKLAPSYRKEAGKWHRTNGTLDAMFAMFLKSKLAYKASRAGMNAARQPWDPTLSPFYTLMKAAAQREMQPMASYESLEMRPARVVDGRVVMSELMRPNEFMHIKYNPKSDAGFGYRDFDNMHLPVLKDDPLAIEKANTMLMEMFEAASGPGLSRWLEKHKVTNMVTLKMKTEMSKISNFFTKHRPYFVFPYHESLAAQMVNNRGFKRVLNAIQHEDSTTCHNLGFHGGHAEMLMRKIVALNEGIWGFNSGDDQYYQIVRFDYHPLPGSVDGFRIRRLDGRFYSSDPSILIDGKSSGDPIEWEPTDTLAPDDIARTMQAFNPDFSFFDLSQQPDVVIPIQNAQSGVMLKQEPPVLRKVDKMLILRSFDSEFIVKDTARARSDHNFLSGTGITTKSNNITIWSVTRGVEAYVKVKVCPPPYREGRKASYMLASTLPSALEIAHTVINDLFRDKKVENVKPTMNGYYLGVKGVGFVPKDEPNDTTLKIYAVDQLKPEIQAFMGFRLVQHEIPYLQPDGTEHKTTITVPIYDRVPRALASLAYATNLESQGGRVSGGYAKGVLLSRCLGLAAGAGVFNDEVYAVCKDVYNRVANEKDQQGKLMYYPAAPGDGDDPTVEIEAITSDHPIHALIMQAAQRRRSPRFPTQESLVSYYLPPELVAPYEAWLKAKNLAMIANEDAESTSTETSSVNRFSLLDEDEPEVLPPAATTSIEFAMAEWTTPASVTRDEIKIVQSKRLQDPEKIGNAPVSKAKLLKLQELKLKAEERRIARMEKEQQHTLNKERHVNAQRDPDFLQEDIERMELEMLETEEKLLAEQEAETAAYEEWADQVQEYMESEDYRELERSEPKEVPREWSEVVHRRRKRGGPHDDTFDDDAFVPAAPLVGIEPNPGPRYAYTPCRLRPRDPQEVVIWLSDEDDRRRRAVPVPGLPPREHLGSSYRANREATLALIKKKLVGVELNPGPADARSCTTHPDATPETMCTCMWTVAMDQMWDDAMAMGGLGANPIETPFPAISRPIHRDERKRPPPRSTHRDLPTRPILATEAERMMRYHKIIAAFGREMRKMTNDHEERMVAELLQRNARRNWADLAFEKWLAGRASTLEIEAEAELVGVQLDVGAKLARLQREARRRVSPIPIPRLTTLRDVQTRTTGPIQRLLGELSSPPDHTLGSLVISEFTTATWVPQNPAPDYRHVGAENALVGVELNPGPPSRVGEEPMPDAESMTRWTRCTKCSLVSSTVVTRAGPICFACLARSNPCARCAEATDTRIYHEFCDPCSLYVLREASRQYHLLGALENKEASRISFTGRALPTKDSLNGVFQTPATSVSAQSTTAVTTQAGTLDAYPVPVGPNDLSRIVSEHSVLRDHDWNAFLSNYDDATAFNKALYKWKVAERREALLKLGVPMHVNTPEEFYKIFYSLAMAKGNTIQVRDFMCGFARMHRALSLLARVAVGIDIQTAVISSSTPAKFTTGYYAEVLADGIRALLLLQQGIEPNPGPSPRTTDGSSPIGNKFALLDPIEVAKTRLALRMAKLRERLRLFAATNNQANTPTKMNKTSEEKKMADMTGKAPKNKKPGKLGDGKPKKGAKTGKNSTNPVGKPKPSGTIPNDEGNVAGAMAGLARKFPEMMPPTIAAPSFPNNMTLPSAAYKTAFTINVPNVVPSTEATANIGMCIITPRLVNHYATITSWTGNTTTGPSSTTVVSANSPNYSTLSTTAAFHTYSGICVRVANATSAMNASGTFILASIQQAAYGGFTPAAGLWDTLNAAPGVKKLEFPMHNGYCIDFQGSGTADFNTVGPTITGADTSMGSIVFMYKSTVAQAVVLEVTEIGTQVPLSSTMGVFPTSRVIPNPTAVEKVINAATSSEMPNTVPAKAPERKSLFDKIANALGPHVRSAIGKLPGGGLVNGAYDFLSNLLGNKHLCHVMRSLSTGHGLGKELEDPKLEALLPADLLAALKVIAAFELVQEEKHAYIRHTTAEFERVYRIGFDEDRSDPFAAITHEPYCRLHYDHELGPVRREEPENKREDAASDRSYVTMASSVTGSRARKT